MPSWECPHCQLPQRSLLHRLVCEGIVSYLATTLLMDTTPILIDSQKSAKLVSPTPAITGKQLENRGCHFHYDGEARTYGNERV